jgi:ferredoxin, 2Fe-2S
MISIEIIDAVGQRHHLSGDIGETIRDVAEGARIHGAMGECGGFLACGTCHIIIDDSWSDRVGVANDDENFMLDGALGRKANSRLACQMNLDESLNGLIVSVCKA